MSSKTERLKTHVKTIDHEEPTKEQATREAQTPMTTRAKNKGAYVMIDNMTGKPIPGTFVTADDRRIMHGSSTPAPKADATPVSILKKDNASSSIKTSESSTKDVRFTSPDKDGKSGSQVASSPTLGNHVDASSSKPGAENVFDAAQMTDDRKMSPTTSTPKDSSGIPPLDDVTHGRTQTGTPGSIPSSISATSPGNPELDMNIDQMARAMNKWDVSMSEYLSAPHNEDDDIPFQDYSFGSGYTSSKIDKIIQAPQLDEVKADRAAMIEKLEDLLGDEVTPGKRPPPIGATPTGAEEATIADEGEPLKIPRHFKEHVDFGPIIDSVTDAATNYVPKDSVRSTPARDANPDGEVTPKRDSFMKSIGHRARNFLGNKMSRKKSTTVIQQPVEIWDGLKEGMTVEEPTEEMRRLYNDLSKEHDSLAQNYDLGLPKEEFLPQLATILTHITGSPMDRLSSMAYTYGAGIDMNF